MKYDPERVSRFLGEAETIFEDEAFRARLIAQINTHLALSCPETMAVLYPPAPEALYQVSSLIGSSDSAMQNSPPAQAASQDANSARTHSLGNPPKVPPKADQGGK